jgi:hypothetical protein
LRKTVQGIAITSYQGGHVEFFKYMKDLLDENGCGHIKIFGGWWGYYFTLQKLRSCIIMASRGFIAPTMAGKWALKE